ncbi:MAG: hypothetical protein WBO12_20085 [Xanthobacteraceae bacterium]
MLKIIGVIWLGSVSWFRHARPPLPAALKSPDNNRLFDLSRLQKADFLPPLGNLIFTQIVQAVFALGI